MKQVSLGLNLSTKKTRKREFLEQMNKVVPWDVLVGVVEHPFRLIKKQFGHVKVRYRGLAKNTAQLKTLFMLSNLWMVRGKLMAGVA